MPSVRVQGLVKRFSTEDRRTSKSYVAAVDDVSFEAPDGQIFTLLGPSGCGKTTTLRCIAGLEKPDEGQISIGNEAVYSKDTFVPPEKRKLGMVFQSYAIWPHMTVFDNVAYPLKVRGVERSAMKNMVRKALELVKLEEFENRPATQLSGGQQQRVALARALVYEPSVILLDEPLSNLDAKLREYMRSELRELLQGLRMTALYVTHDQIEALVISDIVGVMNEGKLLELGSPGKMYSSPENRFVADFIGLANFIPGKAVKVDGSVETAIGSIRCSIPQYIEEGADVLLCVRPENIFISRERPASKSNVFEATVSMSAFVGEFYDCWFSLDSQIIRAHVHPMNKVNRGDKVYIHFDPAFCLLIKLR